jgi:arabinose-5-phosphate isomerase
VTRPTNSVDILAEIERVLDIEIEALQSVRATLDGKFAEAVEVIAACKGQVVLTGVGKSGIIATKIAATFRSTGTAAIFLHAGEALHGDIGTVRPGDIVIAVGKSGETSELNTLLRMLKRNGIFVISITSTPTSAMAALSDLVLDLKISKEACPLNLAPTASTTAALAVGDALAVALMKVKNISEIDFARHHPGGQLGKRLLLRVEDVMRQADQNPILKIGSSVQEMLVQITAFRVGAISIVDEEGKLLGLVTDYDIRKMLESGCDLLSVEIKDVMNPSPSVLYSDEKAIDALESMRHRSKPTAVMPVLDREEHVIGMVHLHDLISAGL